MVTLATGIMFLLFTFMYSWVWGVLRTWSACEPMKWSAIVQSLRNTVLMNMYVCTYVCMYVCMYARTHVCMYVCMRVCMYVFICVYACTHVCVYVCT
jgi:hypothetical protein